MLQMWHYKHEVENALVQRNQAPGREWLFKTNYLRLLFAAYYLRLVIAAYDF